jgi:putative acetyltransferase
MMARSSIVMLSRLDVLGDRPWSALTLAPLAVLESHQRTVGSSLTQEALRHPDDLGEAVVVVFGHPSYYPRLGFVSATGIGIYFPEGVDVPSEAWMAKPLTQYTADMRGTVSYSSEFIETESVPGL